MPLLPAEKVGVRPGDLCTRLWPRSPVSVRTRTCFVLSCTDHSPPVSACLPQQQPTSPEPPDFSSLPQLEEFYISLIQQPPTTGGPLEPEAPQSPATPLQLSAPALSSTPALAESPDKRPDPGRLPEVCRRPRRHGPEKFLGLTRTASSLGLLC